ncbi:PRD domain-containing protein [Absicoccus porci]|uniref:BglG family transcription antiterminator n=1 Tax=Absicoccus porci TaxID=2486576 RepID=UPI002941BD85|nr:PRD domain-containing protein [Absicoccus porci]
MNNEQLKNVIRKIIQILMAEDIVSTRQLADRLSISIKSMRNKIEQTNDFLINNGFGHIEKKPRVGIWLVVNASMQNDLVRFVNGQSEGVLANEGQDRKAYVLGTLLKLLPNEAVTTQQMADALYISLPTVLKVIKEVQEWLDVYDIRIVNERNRGYSLAYQEHAYRMAVKSYICDVAQPESVGMFFHTIDIQLIKKAILQVEDEWNYMFTDESFDEIVVYCCLAVQRRKISIPTNISNADIETLQHYNEYPFTIAIFKRIEDLLHIQISDDDIYFLATQIMCSKFMEFNRSQDVWDAIHTYDEKLLHFVDEVIETIGNVLQKNLSNDQRLRESLIFHLRPTIFRLRYGAPQTNSMLNFIKTEYKTVFRATWSISILFEKYYE